MYIGFLEDDDFGKVLFYTRKGMRSVRMKWNKYQQLEVTMPRIPSIDEMKGILDLNRAEIKALRARVESREPVFYEGQIIPCCRYHLEISRKPKASQYYDFGFSPGRGCFFISVPQQCDIAGSAAGRALKACMKKLAHRHAAAIILPLAEEVAHEKGCTVRGFVMGRGLKKLGHCTRDRVISLSSTLMYYPEELVRYVICQQLAHLKEMNHSAAFHAECNRLCGGREKELEQKLRSFPLLCC